MLHAILDFCYKMLLIKFGGQRSIWRAKVANIDLNLGLNLASFLIENGENA